MIQYGRVGRSFHRHHYHGDVLKNAGNDDLLLLLFCFFNHFRASKNNRETHRVCSVRIFHLYYNKG